MCAVAGSSLLGRRGLDGAMACPDSSSGAAGTVDFEDAGVGAAHGVVISTSLRLGHSTMAMAMAMAMARRSLIEETTQICPR